MTVKATATAAITTAATITSRVLMSSDLVVRPSTLPERRYSRWAVEGPVPDPVSIEPHEAQQSVCANTCKQVRDFCRLVGAGRHACLRNKDRVNSQRTYGLDSRPEQGSESPGWLVIVTINPYPGD